MLLVLRRYFTAWAAIGNQLPAYVQIVPWFAAYGGKMFLGDFMPKALVTWFPPLCMTFCYIVMKLLEFALASKASSALLGQEAPDVEFEFREEGKKSLKALIRHSKLPTVVDFYENFEPSCGPAARHIDRLAADPKYTGKVSFLLCNMSSLEEADKYAEQEGLQGHAMHGCGRPPAEYGIMYIPHRVLIDKEGKVIKNFKADLPGDLDALLNE